MMPTTARLEQESKEHGWSTWRGHDAANHCLRCGGLMVMEQLLDLQARRCVQCGEVVDPVILRNRQGGVFIGMN